MQAAPAQQAASAAATARARPPSCAASDSRQPMRGAQPPAFTARATPETAASAASHRLPRPGWNGSANHSPMPSDSQTGSHGNHPARAIAEGRAGRSTTRRRGRALWGMATDEIVESLRYVGQLLGEEERALRELELLLPGATRPYVGAAGFRRVSGPEGGPTHTRDRISCCMFYTLRPEDVCATCPRACGGAKAVTRELAKAS